MAGFSPFEGLVRALIKSDLFERLVHRLAQPVGYAARSYRTAFYVLLAAVFAVLIGLNALVETIGVDAKAQSLDFTVRHRLSSPKPDPMIVILDIDERSLAGMAEEYGRWPWPRSVLAEAIATLNDRGARAIVLNVMLSDPDKANPDADRIFQEVAVATPRVVYPLIRLNRNNDALSQVTVSMIPGAVILDKPAAAKTIAVLIPLFPGTHEKLGVANLQTDKDGVVRRYAVWWNEPGFRLPSMAQRAVAAAGAQTELNAAAIEKGVLLNWRNKRGDYQRISFVDAYAAMTGRGNLELATFKDSIVIIGVSAPGIATVKGTSASPITDDNAILATAVDDLKNDTYLRRLPIWLSAIVSLIVVALLARAFYLGVQDKTVNRWFGLGQSALVVVTLGSASYTPYLIDLTDSFFFGLAFFVIAKVHAIVDRSASRGVPAFARLGADPKLDQLIVVGFSGKELKRPALARVRSRLEHLLGVRNIFVLDNVFGEAHLFSPVCEGWRYFVIFGDKEQCRKTPGGGVEVYSGEVWISLDDLMRDLGVGGHVRLVSLPAEVARDAIALQRRVGEQLIELSAQMIQAGR